MKEKKRHPYATPSCERIELEKEFLLLAHCLPRNGDRVAARGRVSDNYLIAGGPQGRPAFPSFFDMLTHTTETKIQRQKTWLFVRLFLSLQ